MKVYSGGHKPCPYGGVGISNPGYWGMVQNFDKGKRYKVVYHVKSETKIDFQLSFKGVDVIKVASNTRHVFGDRKWKRVETIVEAKNTNHYSSLQITTTSEGRFLLDQGHGFRKDLFQMVADLKPKFLRFPDITGKIQFDHGKRDLDISMIFGTIGLTMELVILNISKCSKHLVQETVNIKALELFNWMIHCLKFVSEKVEKRRRM
ncbi:hypothetical protein VNO80_03423 [Phaseolus coccineus]|uniref:Uncharacterized protein n=1 Tax=Phaseolus coccineus TaxID=3886 RepID=A0AAN9RNL0_PHACN